MKTITIEQQALIAEYAVKMGLSYDFSEAFFRRVGEDAFKNAVQF